MSLYCEIETEFRDEDVLVRSLQELGFEGKVEQHARAVPLEGYEGVMRAQKANVILRRKHLNSYANDIGFVRGTDGRFTLIVSEWDRANTFGEDVQARLKRAYLEKAAVKEYGMRGYHVKQRVVHEDGRVVLRIGR